MSSNPRERNGPRNSGPVDVATTRFGVPGDISRRDAAALRALILAMLPPISACAGATIDDGEWIGTITSEGSVTTTVNERGSIWDGTARLVEEVTIGVANGPDEYLLGEVASVFADGERILIVDSQIPSVRAYDYDGIYLGDLGTVGQGPGEYRRPSLVTGGHGLTYVADMGSRRINLYEDTTPIDEWPAPDLLCCYLPAYAIDDRRILVPARTAFPEQRLGVRVYGPTGPEEDSTWVPDFRFEPVVIDVQGHPAFVSFTPYVAWAPMPTGGLVAGVTGSYRFEIHDRGQKRIVILESGTPVAVHPEEAEWRRRAHVAFMRTARGIEGYDWDGAEIPSHKPAYAAFFPSLTGEIWVARDTTSVRVPGCRDPLEDGMDAYVTAPCWHADWAFDVFDAEGRYLGPVEPIAEMPQHEFQRRVFVDGDTVLATTEDEDGVVQVRRFRVERQR